MITSTRIGRYGNTGNSMFQFAALIGIAKKNNLDYVVPYNETYYDVNYECNNTSIFDGFNLNVDLLDSSELIFKESQYPWEYVERKIDDYTDICGYFQSEKYFDNAKLEVAAQFKFKDLIKEVVDSKIKSGHYPNPDNCTSLHVRRGDYVHKQEYHPLQTKLYYETASKLTATDNYIIFSDDIEWCKETFGDSSKLVYSEEENPFSAMYHMSLCRNNIICNSTFGWWAAWLGEQNNPLTHKVIVAPEQWFGPAYSNMSIADLIPERWTKL